MNLQEIHEQIELLKKREAALEEKHMFLFEMGGLSTCTHAAIAKHAARYAIELLEELESLLKAQNHLERSSFGQTLITRKAVEWRIKELEKEIKPRLNRFASAEQIPVAA